MHLGTPRLNKLQKRWRELSPTQKVQQLNDLSQENRTWVIPYLDQLLEHDERTKTDSLLADCRLSCDDWTAGWCVTPSPPGLENFGGPRVIAAVCAGPTQASDSGAQSTTPSRKQEGAESDQ